MEKVNFEYSLKNIPTPSDISYKLKLTEKIGSVIRRMRWKAKNYLKNDKHDDSNERKENYGFKTRNCPGQCKELNEFENDLLSMIKTVKFRKVNDSFQSRLKADINKINNSSNVFVFADKTSNVYEMKPDDYKKILKENITKTYQITSNNQ